MATIPHSTLLFDNVNKLLTTFIPAHSRRDSNQLYTSIGVKSHGTITCKCQHGEYKIVKHPLNFVQLVETNRIKRILFVYHPIRLH